MKTMILICGVCGEKYHKSPSQHNRSIKMGWSEFCSKKCAGIHRRVNKSNKQKKEEKRLYDIEYRKLNKEKLRKSHAEYFKRTYDPKKAAVERKKKMHRHIEYCRRPEYKKYKKQYDRNYRAKKKYGSFWEAFLILLDLDDAIKNSANRYEIRSQNEILNKTQKRRREYARLNSNKS